MDYRQWSIDQKKITQPCSNQSKKHTFALGQGLYDQLLSNPPGLDRSKGRWLSGAIWVLAYFFCADFRCTTLFPPVLEYLSFLSYQYPSMHRCGMQWEYFILHSVSVGFML